MIFGKVAGENCTFAFDNCASQNKDRIILRFPIRMVDIKRLRLCFLLLVTLKIFVTEGSKI